ncbi:HugZ family pyridoxamine 5'-phosphate oxidase [Acidihalobacter prosperus]|uniref:Pyridoxamine 5'-phosphate oxidase N-terminal domain-containing protein n=1 Tax=Acidihalobacter prosperus TaxID=160660 RepID=A0A1A6C5R7_9GAMM|nr:pyridoxamine 5'-phosphate oxidase family protein [Acidihalobacter prosperus]OBS09889.1 hypothetical protein Thpro_020939 [Acidihalobacter prosperus]
MNGRADEAPRAALDALYAGCRSLILATLDDDGVPHASPAPFVRDDAHGDYYVYVSGLSAHTRHLATGRPASVLLIEDEAATAQIFARVRLSQTCAVDEIAQASPAWGHRLEAFSERFGQVIEVLRSLPDFRLFRLRPRDGGRFVTGFGRAFDLRGDELVAVGPPAAPPEG